MNPSRDLLDRLKAESMYWFGNLTETVRRGDQEIPLAEATVDDIVLAARELEDHVRPISHRMMALRDLHECARKRGGLGADRIADIFSTEEVPE